MMQQYYVYHHQTKPLYELVTSRDFVQDASLKRNLRRALSEYLAETSSCRCAPCRNNGVAVLKGSSHPTTYFNLELFSVELY